MNFSIESLMVAISVSLFIPNFLKEPLKNKSFLHELSRIFILRDN